MDGQRIGNLWVKRCDSACLFAFHMHSKKERTDIDAHNVKIECNMKIVPFKGVLWLLRGARRQLHGKRRLRVLWLLVGARHLVMHAKKGRTWTSTAETLIVCFNCWCTNFCNFKGNEIHIRYMKFICFSFFLEFFFSFGFAFLYSNHVGYVFFFVFKGGLERVNLSYAIASPASIFPSVLISLSL